MSPNDTEAFESCWRDIAHDLDIILIRRGIEEHTRQDLIQETALRLLARWERLDKTRPVVPLAATIALNLMRDGFRRAKHEVISEVEPSAPAGDVEHEGLARLELGRVAKAMKKLSSSYRNVLLANVSDEAAAATREPRLVASDGSAIERTPVPERSPAATKMLRMRARRRLARLLESAGIMVAAVRLRLHQLFNEPAQASAAAFSAGAVLITALVIPQPDSSPRATPDHEIAVPVATRSGDVEPKRLFAAPEMEETTQGGAPVTGSGGDPGGAPDPAEGKEPDARADADVKVDPSGETVAGADTGYAVVEARRSPDDDYSACVSIRTDPTSESACDDDDS